MLYTDEANKYYQEINRLTLSEYKQRADILEGKAEENLQTALPYMETALMLEPKNPDVLRS